MNRYGKEVGKLDRFGVIVMNKISAKDAQNKANEKRKAEDTKLLDRCFKEINAAAEDGLLGIRLPVSDGVKKESFYYVTETLRSVGFVVKFNYTEAKGIQNTIEIYWADADKS